MAGHPGIGRGGGRRVYVALGRGEARAGRSLEALLAAYRVGARVAWRRAAEAGLAAGLAPETLVLLAEAIFAYIDELSAESAEGFAREQAEQAGEADRRRAALLEVLLHEPPAAPEALAAAAEAAGWRVPERLAMVVWPADRGGRPARRLPLGAFIASLDAHVCAVVPDPARAWTPRRGRGRGRRRARRHGARGASRRTPRARTAARWRRSPWPRSWARPACSLAAEHRADLLGRPTRRSGPRSARSACRPSRAETDASRRAPGSDAPGLAAPRGRRPRGRRRSCTSTHRPSATAWRACATFWGPRWTIPTRRFELEFALRTAPKAR